MDNRQFDSLVMTLTTNGGPRRRMMQTLGASGIAAVLGRLGLESDAEAKKKGKNKNKRKKKCKGNTRKCNGKCIPQDSCCVDGDCAAGEICQNGACVDDGNGQCQSSTDCAANESCINGECLCAFPDKPCGDICCAEDEACVEGQCLVGQGTCAAGNDICNGVNVACNGNDNCFCGERIDGQPRCIQFINDSRDACTCGEDFDCEQDFGTGAICIKGGSSCACQNESFGRCARLCPTQPVD
jgi:hypothetical protein